MGTCANETINPLLHRDALKGIEPLSAIRREPISQLRFLCKAKVKEPTLERKTNRALFEPLWNASDGIQPSYEIVSRAIYLIVQPSKVCHFISESDLKTLAYILARLKGGMSYLRTRHKGFTDNNQKGIP